MPEPTLYFNSLLKCSVKDGLGYMKRLMLFLYRWVLQLSKSVWAVTDISLLSSEYALSPWMEKS